MKETQLHSSFALKTCFLRLDPWPYLPSDIVILKIEFLNNLFNPVVTTVIVNEPPDTAESELENDMLGSVKSPEWNDKPTEDQDETAFPVATNETRAKSSEKKDDNLVCNNEENEWDWLLRVRQEVKS
ncbi:Protein CHROMATIN REMODELING 4 [Abeliophyllum distichum]|uniref:Protein CHROMATIN REMODELING 4 n=1 Tax=Abeliophyllum distichum TaxID=126358 RepID=A0ABD1UI57_9LAMI